MTRNSSHYIWGAGVTEDPPEELSRLAEDVLKQIGKNRRHTRGVTQEVSNSDKRACRWLIASLHQGERCIPPAPVVLPRGKGFFSGGTEAGAHLPPFPSVMRAIDAAEQLGFIDVDKNKFQLGRRQFASRMYAAGVAKDTIHSDGPTWWKVQPLKRTEQILIGSRRGGKRRGLNPIELQTPRVVRWLDDLSLVNQLLAETLCFLDVPDDLLQNIGMGITSKSQQANNAAGGINYAGRQLVRIFIDDSMSTGGRFYGGWWQAVPSRYRRNIVIDDCQTVEVDFSGIALRCLYARMGAKLPNDPYDIGLCFTGSSDPRRKLVKTYVNACLNDEKGRFRLSKEQLTTVGLSHAELDRRIRSRLKPVAQFFGTGIGIELQFLDSEIAIGILVGLAKQGIPCLPIHDSFIVQAHHELRLVQLMQQEFNRNVGTTCPVSVDLDPNVQRRWDFPLFPPPGQSPEFHLSNICSWLGRYEIAQAMAASWYDWKRKNGFQDRLVDFGTEDVLLAARFLIEKVREPSEIYQRELWKATRA